MKELIVSLINEEINPALSVHQGGCEFVSLEDGVANIRLTGACTRCPGRRMTFEYKVIPYLISKIDGLTKVNIID